MATVEGASRCGAGASLRTNSGRTVTEERPSTASANRSSVLEMLLTPPGYADDSCFDGSRAARTDTAAEVDTAADVDTA